MREKEDYQTFTIRLPKKMHRLLKELAFFSDTSANQIIIDSLEKIDLVDIAEKARKNYETK